MGIPATWKRTGPLNPRIDRLTASCLLPGYDIDYNSRSYYRSRSKAAKANDLGAITRIKI